MDKLYTIQEVATKLNLSDKTLRRWEEAGRFTPNRTLGNQRRYSIEDLQILDAIKHGTINGQSDLLTLEQAAMLCGVTPSTLTLWENDGKIHPFITSGNTYYPKNRLLDKMAELKNYHKTEAVEEPEPTISSDLPPTNSDPEPSLHISEPTPSLTPLHTHPQLKITSPPTQPFTQTFNLQSSLFNVAITIVLILTYHLLFNSSAPKQVSPQTNQGSVQGDSTAKDPTIDLLRTMLDPSGALTTTTLTSRVSLTSPLLTLSPNSAPTNPTTGMVYYDSSTQSLRIYKNNRWQDLNATNSYVLSNSELITGSGILPKGSNQTSVTNDKITPTTPVTVTFATDYSPAKKYWITPDQGSFTLSTDFPVGSDSTFFYNLITQDSTPSAIINP